MTYATVRASNSTELGYIRTAGQWSRLYLAFLTPPTVYTAQLASLPSSYDRVGQISFTSGSGTLANVFPGMTLYVGTTAGAYDLGMARIRKDPVAGTFYIGEESEINWQASCYLTVVADFQLWAKHIVTVSDTVFYMDFDIVYSNQNSVFDPIPIMGGHRVLKLTGASVNTIFDFSNSYVIGSTISTYSVSVPTASGITGGSTATPTVTFNTAGWHPVYLTVTAANGKSFRGVRYVYVYSAASMPATVFQLGSCSVDYETGGWSFEVTMQEEIGLSSVPERALCILFAEEYYGDTNVSIGQLTGCENIICVGRIAEESINVNSEQSEVSLRIQGSQHWMSKIYAFPTGVITTTSTPANWAEMQDPTVDKVVYRLLHWGSTATMIMDCYLTNDTRIASELISPASNLWAQITELAMSSIQARPGVDRFGRLFVEVEPQLVPLANRTYATVMTLTKEDYIDGINVQRVVVSPTGMIDASGVVVYTGNTGDAIFSLSPGNVFKRYGSPEIVDRLLLSTQALSNQLAGLFLGWRNNPYPSVELKLSANNRMIDCFPRQRVEWSVSTGDTPRGISITSGKFIPRRVDIAWDADSGFLEVSLSLELESVEQLSKNGNIPGTGEDVDITNPPAPPPFPEIPPFVVVTAGDIPAAITTRVVVHIGTLGVCLTENFDNALPTWNTINTGLTATQRNVINFMDICPNGAFYVGFCREQTSGELNSFIARAPYVGAPFVVQTIPFAVLNTIAINPTKPEEICFWGGAAVGGKAQLYIGANNSFVAGLAIGGFGSGGDGAADMLSYGEGHWLLMQTNAYRRLNAGASAVVASGTLNSKPRHIRAGTTGTTFHEARLSGEIFKGENNCTTVTTVTPDTENIIFSPTLAPRCGDADPTGTYLMTRGLGGTGGGKAKSSDAGATWVGLPNLFPSSGWFFKCAGKKDRWIAGGGSTIQLTENFGDHWDARTGNLSSMMPTGFTCDIIRVVG